MYTGREIQNLILRSGYQIEQVLYTTVGEPEEKDKKVLQELTKYMEVGEIGSFMAYQYIVRAVKTSGESC